MLGFSLLSVAALVFVTTVMAWRRGGRFAVFVGVLLGVYSLIACAMVPASGPLLWAFTALHLTVYGYWIRLCFPRMPSLPVLIAVSWPSAVMFSGTLLAWPWAVAIGLHFHPWGAWVPYVLALIGMRQSLTNRREELDLVIPGPSGERTEGLAPHPHGLAREHRPLQIVQITDPHLGSFMSVARLKAIATRAVEAKPDLIFLTGDFLTVESQHDPELLRQALTPLSAYEGRTFACFGNHDHEAPELVRRAMRENGIQLLVDDAALVETPAGPVQIVGMDFVYQDRAGHLARVTATHPRHPSALRIVLLHDPGAFRHLPADSGDLVLSGHTHGGQVGLVSLGLSFTVLRTFGVRLPDHGFWARGTDRMYVHRGTGHYGFPLRLGVPAEESLLRIHRVSSQVPKPT